MMASSRLFIAVVLAVVAYGGVHQTTEARRLRHRVVGAPGRPRGLIRYLSGLRQPATADTDSFPGRAPTDVHVQFRAGFGPAPGRTPSSSTAVLDSFVASGPADTPSETADLQGLQVGPQLQGGEGGQPRPDLANNGITFYVFIRGREHATVLHVGDEGALSGSGFSFRRPTKVLIHGFTSNVNKTMMTSIKDAYLQTMDVNVVSVDWSPLSAMPWYGAARANVEVVGPRLAALLDWLAGRGAALSSFHLVGHSLGAHVAGVAGTHLRAGRVSRISGLDPARPGFRNVDLANRLDPGDADLVDVIHTTAGYLGLEQPVGHIDFYPNGGVYRQPGCLPDLYGRCSHEKAFRIFRESIDEHQFEAVSCDSMQAAMAGRCAGHLGVMGEGAARTQPGIYYAVTR